MVEEVEDVGEERAVVGKIVVKEGVVEEEEVVVEEKKLKAEEIDGWKK